MLILSLHSLQAIADIGLKATPRFASPTGRRCMDLFVNSNQQGLKPNHLSEFKLQTQKFTPDGEWWHAAKEIQKHLDSSSSLASLVEKLKDLGEKSKKIRRAEGTEDFYNTDFYFNIFISVDYIKPLLKFKNGITTAHKNEILKYLSQILNLPWTERNKSSFSAFYKAENQWETPYTLLMMFEAFLSKNKLDDFLTIGLIENTAGINTGVGRGNQKSGWEYVNPSLLTLLSTLEPEHRATLIVKLRQFIIDNKKREKDTSLAWKESSDASSYRRNGETILNLLFYPETLQFIETLKTHRYKTADVLAKVDHFLEQKNGAPSELSFATLRLVAKEVSATFLQLGLYGDIHIVGSALSGRFKKDSSDFDLILNAKVQTYIRDGFKIDEHMLISFNKPTSRAYRETAKVLLQMQKRVHALLGNKSNENIFSSSGISIISPDYTVDEQRDAILFGFSSLNNNFSIRIQKQKIFLGIYDPLSYTNYELDITNL